MMATRQFETVQTITDAGVTYAISDEGYKYALWIAEAEMEARGFKYLRTFLGKPGERDIRWYVRERVQS